jgi:hypothetical protein
MKTKRIVHFSDTRGFEEVLEKKRVPQGDIIIFSGNCTQTGYHYQFSSFIKWFGELPHEYKIFIGGTNDTSVENMFSNTSKELLLFLYKSLNKNFFLQDEAVTIDGLHIYGTPFSPKRDNRTAFTLPVTELTSNYAHIPTDTQLLVTACPPYGKLDGDGREGSHILNQAVNNLPNLLLHCFGGGGNHGIYDTFETRFSNGTLSNGDYGLDNFPLAYDIEYD